MGSFKESVNDQYFLLNFIMSTYLGPDVCSDIPRRSASQRLAEGLPPYTTKNLGFSFVSFPQLESLYYYVLRNAHPSLVVKPFILHMYLKGDMPLPTSELPVDCLRFTGFFPTNIHGHKRYPGHYEIVKGIILIDDPVTSFMKTEDLERCQCLTGMDDLKINKIKSLCYEHEYRKCQEEEKHNRVENGKEIAAGKYSDGNHYASAKFEEMCKERRLCDTPPMPAIPNVVLVPKQHIVAGASQNSILLQETCKGDGPAMMPLLAAPNIDKCMSDASVTLTGTAAMGISGPPIGVVDIGISKLAYFFRVALRGVRRDYCQFSCEIESDGKIHIQGSTSGGKIIRKRSRVFHMKFQQLCPPGQFTLTFSLPGPVDPQLFSPNFRSDGIFEAIVIRHK